MSTDATGSNGSGEATLRATLERHRAELERKTAAIEADLASGDLTPAQAADAIHTARAAYDRDCTLAEIATETGWETWTGVGGVLYARRPKTSPPKVVRAPSAAALREAIQAQERR